jgi:hypothetical protein
MYKNKEPGSWNRFVRAFTAVVYRPLPGSLRMVGSRKNRSHPRRSTTG